MEITKEAWVTSIIKLPGRAWPLKAGAVLLHIVSGIASTNRLAA